MKTGIIPGLLIIIAIVRSTVLNARLIINKKFVGNIINEGILNIGNEDIQHVVFEQYLSLTTLKHSFSCQQDSPGPLFSDWRKNVFKPHLTKIY